MLLSKKRLHAPAGLATTWNVVILQYGLFASIGDRMEIQRESFRFRQQYRREFLHPRSQQLLLVLTPGAIRVVRRERFFGQHVQAREQPEPGIDVVVVDVAQTFFAKQLQRQQTEQCRIARNHLGPWIVRFANQSIEP